MGTRHVIRHGRHPEEETMNFSKLTVFEVVSYLGIATAMMVILLSFGGCAHKTVSDPKQCCSRLSLHEQEMQTFTRYCKVALFLHKGNTINDKKVKDLAKRGVGVCKFVFGVNSEEQLLSVADLNEGYHKVRHYIIKPEDVFWRESLPCDPLQPSCEEF